MMILTKQKQAVRALRTDWLIAIALTLFLTGCGGSGNPPSQASAASETTTECDSDGQTADTGDDCGEVYIGITDADGDFVTYTVDITSLTLLRGDGTVVHALPSSARVDFAQYTDLTEFLTAASVPPGIYVSGSITLDYTQAEIVVENGAQMTDAVVVDAGGQPLVTAEMELVLDQRKQLVVQRGVPSLFTVDFDLGASHEVNFGTSPVTATAEPFLLAEVDPVDSKELRLRGPLIGVAVDESAYVINVRPFHLRDGRFGRARVHTGGSTVFEIDGTTYEATAGLEAMSALPQGSPTVAFGKLNVLTRTYLAERVYAGSSVPGFDLDVVRGNVIAREGNTLKVKGAVLVPRQGRAGFHREVTVLIGDSTRVLKAGYDQTLDLSAISVGQRITAFGSASADSGIVLDATTGRVRMLVTHLNGTVNSAIPGQVDLSLQSIDKRPARTFDFAGTGLSEVVDADADNYEVKTGDLDLSGAAAGAPVKVLGFVEAFGAAPPDFAAHSVVDYSDARALLAIGWDGEGTLAPFVSLDADGVVLDLGNPEIGARHYIRQGGVFTDMLTLSASPLILSHPDVPGVFAIKQDNRIWIHSDFALFVADLAGRLDGNTRVRGMYAKGGYAPDTGLFGAARIGVLLD